MIQRQQTLWLLLSAICAVLSFQVPFVTGDTLVSGNRVYAELVAGENMFILLLTAVTLILAVAAIFNFKNRKLQGKLVIAGALTSLITLVIYIMEMQKFLSDKRVLSLGSILPVLTLVGFILAYRGIRKDERLIKSLDKLR